MICLELPEAVEKGKEGMYNMAKDLFRPISRKYDVNEHEYPKELDVFRTMKPQKREVRFEMGGYGNYRGRLL